MIRKYCHHIGFCFRYQDEDNLFQNSILSKLLPRDQEVNLCICATDIIEDSPTILCSDNMAKQCKSHTKPFFLLKQC